MNPILIDVCSALLILKNLFGTYLIGYNLFGSCLIGVPSREPICSSKPPGNSAQRLPLSDTGANSTRLRPDLLGSPVRHSDQLTCFCSGTLGCHPVQRSPSLGAGQPLLGHHSAREPATSAVARSNPITPISNMLQNQTLLDDFQIKFEPKTESSHNLGLFCQNYLSYDLTY